MFQKHAPLAIRPDGSLFQLRWMAAMLKNCSPERYAINKERMMRVAEYSRDCLRELRAETGMRYEHRTQGTLQLFRTQAQLDAVQRDVAVLQECGVPLRAARPPPARRRSSPRWRAAREQLAGGLRLPNDETGDCHLFTRGLADVARGLGVDFRFDRVGREPADRRRAHRRRAAGRAEGEVLKADRYVLAFGSYSRELIAPLGLDIPVYPVKGYSLTVPLVDPALAPQSTVLDETYKIAITRFDDRIRVGGMAELAGFDLRLNPQRRATLERVVGELFPGGDLPRASFWTGLRPMTPDSTPDRRPHALLEPVPQHRPRHAGLDHGLRLRQAGGRPGDGTAARHPHRRPGDGPLCRTGARAPRRHRAGHGLGLIRPAAARRGPRAASPACAARG